MKTELISLLLGAGLIIMFVFALKVIFVVFSIKLLALLVLFVIFVIMYGNYRFKRGIEKAADFTAEIIKHKK